MTEARITRLWRPVLALAVGAIVLNNYLLSPWLRELAGIDPSVALPDSIVGLFEVVLGALVGSRGLEKIAAWRWPQPSSPPWGGPVA